MKRTRILLLLGILVAAAAYAFNASRSTPARDSVADASATNSDLVPVSTSAGSSAGRFSEDSSEYRPNPDSRRSEVSTNATPKPPSSALNTPGEDFDFSSYLKNGRVTIAYFYADWCPACRELSPRLARINSDDPNMQVLFLNIGEWNTPIAERYRVNSVPFLRIYDQNGYFIAEGDDAVAWLQRTLAGSRQL